MMKIVSFDSVFLVLYLFIYYAYIYGMLRVLGAFRYERGFFFCAHRINANARRNLLNEKKYYIGGFLPQT